MLAANFAQTWKAMNQAQQRAPLQKLLVHILQKYLYPCFWIARYKALAGLDKASLVEQPAGLFRGVDSQSAPTLIYQRSNLFASNSATHRVQLGVAFG